MARGTALAWVHAVLCVTGFLRLQQESIITGVEGHAYMMAPVSRTFWYTPLFQEL